MSRESVRNALQKLSAMTVRLLWTCPHGEGFLPILRHREPITQISCPCNTSPHPHQNLVPVLSSQSQPRIHLPPLPLLPLGPFQPA